MIRFFRIASIVIVAIVLVLWLFTLLLSTARVQYFITTKATKYLSEYVGAKVSVGGIYYKFFNKLNLKNVYIEDLQQDTLIYIGELEVKIQLSALINKKVIIKSAEIFHPHINIHRPTSEIDFNYQFLVDKLSSKDTTKSEVSIELDINRVKAYFLKLNYLDELKRTAFNTSFSSLNISQINFNSKKNNLIIDALVLDDAQINFTKLRKFDLPIDSVLQHVFNTTSEKTIPKEQQAKPPFVFKLNHLLINNSRLGYDNNNYEQQCEGVDYAHVFVSNLKLYAENISLVNDTLTARLQQINANEQSGFQLNRLAADFVMTPNQMEFNNLIIETPKSNITHYYAMSYESINDFADFVNKVRLKGDFTNATVAISDVNYFAKALDPIEHNIITISGQATGTISNLKARNLILEAASNTKIVGDINLNGLPNINETFISASFDKARTSADDLRKIYPTLVLPKELNALGLSRISGNFDGFYYDFAAKAQVVSQIGTITSDINIKFEDGIENASYKGKLATIDFDLGKLINEPLLGNVTLNTEVNGKGLTLNTVESRIDGFINSITANNYNYTNIDVEGLFTKSTFVGVAIAKDPNCQLDFNGEIDFSSNIPEFNFKSLVHYMNLKKLNILEEDISIKSNLNLNFSGLKIDDIVGQLEIKNTEITKKEKKYFIDNISLESIIFEDEGTEKLILESDIINAEVKGKIIYKDIGKSFKYFFRNYFNNVDLAASKDELEKYSQDFSFYVNVNESTKNLTELLADDFKNIGITNVQGSYNSMDNLLKIKGYCENIDYNKFQFKHINIFAEGSPQTIYTNNSIDSLMYRDSLFTENIKLSAELIRDSIKYNFSVQDTTNPNNLLLSGKIKTDLKSITHQFNNSKFVFNKEPWLVNNDNSLFYDGKILRIDNLEISKDYHKLSVKTNIDKDSSSNLIVMLNDVLLYDLLSTIPSLKRLNISGNANGSITVLDVLGSPIPTAFVEIDSLSLSNQSLGNFKAISNYNASLKQLDINSILKSEINDVIVKGNYYLAETPDSFNFNAQVKQLDISPVQVFLAGIVSETKGLANGNLTLNGNVDKPLLTGKLNIKDVGATVDYLNLALRIKEGEVYFKEDRIDLGSLIINDNSDNVATAKGNIFHNNLNDFRFDIAVNTNRFEFMNTTAANNSQFYGKAYANANVIIKGPLNNLNFDIKATTLKNTKVSISVSESKDVNQYTFYRFIDKDNPEKIKERKYAKAASGVDFNIDLTATPDADVDLVLSSEQGDIITARGDGNLKINYDKFGELSIIGTYTVTEGEYMFSMQNVISKKFQIDKGSQIVWAGSPYDARLAITAAYQLRASPYDLIEDLVRSSNDKLQQARIRVLVRLLLNIGGSISSPDISFDIKVPDADPAIRSALNSKLDFIKLEQSELDKQVVGLLVLNKFLPPYAFGSNDAGATGNVTAGVSNTVSEFVSNQLSNYLSDWLSKFVTDVQLDINYRTYQQGMATDGGSDEFESRRELQLALSKSLLNDRVFIDIGGNFDFGGGGTATDGQTNSNQRGNNVAGDFEIQYAITPDGRYKLKAFRRGEYDIFSERNRNRTGIGVQYKKEFNDFKDLVTPSENKKRRKKNTPLVAE